jgi:hypothetical protein
LMVRITEVSTIEEPGAGKLHAGICALNITHKS